MRGVYSSRPAERVLFRERFTNPATVHANGGVLTGSPTIKNGARLNGTSQYVTYAIPASVFASPEISIVIEFTPDFDWDEDAQRAFFYTGGQTYRVFKRTNANGNTLWMELGDVTIQIASATYSPYWRANRRNTLVISWASGDRKAWLNGTLILSDATAWTPKAETTLILGAIGGGGAYFAGAIHSIDVRKGLLSQLDVDAIQDNSLFTYRSRSTVWFDMKESTARADTTELLTDWDMEAAGVGDWSSLNATLTKESGTRTGGSGSQVLKVTVPGGSGAALENVLTAGEPHRVFGWAQGDGASFPQIWAEGSKWDGTTSTAWQFFDIVFTASSTKLRLYGISSGSVRFDDVSVREVLDQTLDKSKNGAICLLGDGQGINAPSFQNPGFLFDDVNDLLTLPADPTGTFTVAWKRRNEAVVFESDLTTWNLLKTSGAFSGLLDFVALWPFALSPIQKRDLRAELGGLS